MTEEQVIARLGSPEVRDREKAHWEDAVNLGDYREYADLDVFFDESRRVCWTHYSAYERYSPITLVSPLTSQPRP